MIVLVVIVGFPVLETHPWENGHCFCLRPFRQYLTNIYLKEFLRQYLKNISRDLDFGDRGVKFVVVFFNGLFLVTKELIKQHKNTHF